VLLAKKLILLRNGMIVEEDKLIIELPNGTKLKNITIEISKRMGHLLLVEVLRIYVKSSNVAKNKFQEIKERLTKPKTDHHHGHHTASPNGVSKFLQMMSEYKHKIRTIKERIHEEEKNS
jgi:hypothetical protein